MSLLNEFKTFAVRGNMVDMAVGIIMGAAFGKIVSSLVNDIIMPPIGYVIGGVSFSELALILKPAVGEATAVAIKYGMFIQSIVDFLIISAAIFFAVKVINRLQRHKQEAVIPVDPQIQLLTDIRNLLAEQRQNHRTD